MKRKLTLLLAVVLFFASTNSANALTVAEQIALLQTQIAELQAQLNVLIQNQTQTSDTVLHPENVSSSYCVELQYNMRRTARDAYTNGEVTKLQNFLRTRSESDWPQNQRVTGYFGYVTERAVANFQVHHGLVSSTFTSAAGSVGPITRAKIKDLTCNHKVEVVTDYTGSDTIESYALSSNTNKTVYDLRDEITITTVVTNNSNNSLPITFNNGCETDVSIKNVNTGVIHRSTYEYCTQSIRNTSVSGNSSRAWVDTFNNDLEGLPAGTYVAIIGVGNLGEKQTNNFTIQNVDDSNDSDVDINVHLRVGFNLANDQVAQLIGTDYRFKYVQGEYYCVTTPCNQPDPKLIVTNPTLNFYQEVSIANGSSKQIPGTSYYAKILSKIGTIGSGHIINIILNDYAFVDDAQDNFSDPFLQVNSPNGGEVYQQGGVMNITWSAINMPSEGVLGLSFVNQVTGVNYYPLPHCGSTGSNCVDISAGSYQLTIPGTVDPGSYKLRLYCALPNSESYCEGTSVGYEDYSNGSFVVNPSQVGDNDPYIRLVYPNGGEIFKQGDSVSIIWVIPSIQNWEDEVAFTLKNASTGSTVSNDIAQFPWPGVGNGLPDIRNKYYLWTVPDNLPAGNYNLVIVCNSTLTAECDDESDNYFTIVANNPTPETSVSLSASPVSGTAPLAVTFSVLATDIPSCTGSSWNYGDGNVEAVTPGCAPGPTTYNSFTDSRTHTYTEAGTYTVSAGYGSASDTVIIVVNGGNILRGDVNLDGKVSLVDMVLAARYVSGTETLTVDQIRAADMDGDGVVSDWDVVNINQILLNLPEVDFLLGDVNLDGDIDVSDALLVLRHVEGLQTLNTSGKLSADIDSNGIINILDVANIIRIAVGLETQNFMIGDINHDGVIDVTDALMINRYVAGLDQLDTLQIFLADINLDGVVNETDVEQATRLAVGLLVEY